MKNYEIAFIVSPHLSEEEVKTTKEKIKKIIEEGGGKVLEETSWGKKDLAYPIKKEKQGFYEFIIFQSDPALIASFEQKIKLLEEVLRFMICIAIPSPTAEEKKEIKEKAEKPKEKTKKEKKTPPKTSKTTKTKTTLEKESSKEESALDEQYKELDKKLKEILEED